MSDRAGASEWCGTWRGWVSGWRHMTPCSCSSMSRDMYPCMACGGPSQLALAGQRSSPARLEVWRMPTTAPPALALTGQRSSPARLEVWRTPTTAPPALALTHRSKKQSREVRSVAHPHHRSARTRTHSPVKEAVPRC
eukprot:158099-Chlamydomonas_euryale.AAC.2